MTTMAVHDVPATRIDALKSDAMAHGGCFMEDLNPFVRDVALWRAAQGERSRVQVRAAFLHELVALAEIEIRPGWRLAGEHLLSGPGMPFGFQRDPLQWNVVTEERLRQAQEDPEHYGNLVVRVAGYSQMFKLIPKDLQDHMIARTKHRA